MPVLFLKTFAAGVTNLDLLDPLREQDLVRVEATRGIGVQNRVDDITALSLQPLLVTVLSDENKTHGRANIVYVGGEGEKTYSS